jgi:hypothetical protein
MNADEKASQDRLKAMWDNPGTDDDVADELHRHFESFAPIHWVDLCDFSRHLYSLLMEEQMEEFSPLDGLLAAIAAQGSSGAIARIAAIVNVDPVALDLAINEDRISVAPNKERDFDAIGRLLNAHDDFFKRKDTKL